MNDLPPLYARWMRAAAGAEVPREEIATCRSCVMLPAGDAPSTTTFFNPATKCCTFVPELHNFLVGGVLADPDNHPLGTASLERRIDDGVEVTPLGLGRARSFLLLYDDGGDLVFGRAKGLRCPHYIDEQGGICGVWKHRESTCATWFCKHVRGGSGHDTWRAIQRALRIAERDVAWWCIRELGLEIATVQALLAKTSRHQKSKVAASDIDGVRDPAYATLWGRWVGRERELYRRCAEMVAALSWDDVLAIGGPELALAADVVRDLVNAPTALDLSTPLVIAAFSITALHDGQVTITTYNAYDPLTVPVGLLDVLPAFDGRPARDVLDELMREYEIELEPALVQRLVEFGVLARAT